MYHYEFDAVYGMKLLVFDRLAAFGTVKHGFTTRHGGVSEGDCRSLNMSFSREESRANVAENIRRLAEWLGVDYNKVTAVPQVHGCRVKVIDEENCGAGITKADFAEGYDAMITDRPGITLLTRHGDCVPVFLYDPVRRAIGMVHSGWRGTVKRVAEQAVLAMERAYGTDPGDLYAAIGPAICRDCFAVDAPVWEEIAAAFPEHFPAARDSDFPYRNRQTGKWQIGLPQLVADTLAACGVPRENTEVSGICTCCAENEDDYFSHRRTGASSGIMAGAICLAE